MRIKQKSKIYKISPYKVGCDPEYGGQYVAGYSRIHEFDDEDAFCVDLGYWIPYGYIEETDLQSLPTFSTLRMTDMLMELIKSGEVNVDDLLKSAGEPSVENESLL